MPASASPIAHRLSLLAAPVAALGLIVMLGGCDKAPQPRAQRPSDTAAASGDFAGRIDTTHKGSAIPALTFADPAGGRLALAKPQGKPVLVNLWATWCGPCVKELPTLEALAARGDVTVITVSQDMGNPAKVAAALQPMPHLHAWLDPDNALLAALGTGDLPTSVLYDAQGHEVWRMAGGHDWTGPDVPALIAQAAAK